MFCIRTDRGYNPLYHPPEDFVRNAPMPSNPSLTFWLDLIEASNQAVIDEGAGALRVIDRFSQGKEPGR
jgi:hypothetical protein